MRKEVLVGVIEMPPNEPATKINIEVDVSQLLDELKLFDALFNIDLKVGQTNETYHYSFVKRDIAEKKVRFPMFVSGHITDLNEVTYQVYISYISK